MRDYITLTKPRIIALLLVTTVATMLVADPSGPAIATVIWTMIGGYLAAGGAGAINHYLDRERDARMARTRSRPLVSGAIKPVHGLIFGVILGALAFFQLWLTVNLPAAGLAMAGLLGYVFVYTLWLKPMTPQNIVIGGAAGAVPPLVGWAAATGGPRRRRALALPHRLPLDPAALLGPLPADQGRLRPHRRPDDAGRPRRGVDAAPDPRLLGDPRRGDARAGLHRPLRRALRRRRAGARRRLLRIRPAPAAPARPAPPPCALYLWSLSYLALLFAAMAADRMLGA